jgi:hypothetical protein
LPRIREKERLFEAITSYFDFIQKHQTIRNLPLPPLFDGRYCRGNGK